MSDPIVIVSAVRTPLAAFQGEFSTLSANELGAVAIGAALERAGLKPDQVDAVLMGNVLQAGQGQAPARQASIKAGIPSSVGAITVSKVCGSGMQAAMLAHDGIVADTYGVVVAGGMESMTNAPYLLTKARGGYRAGHATMYDHMMLDGLEDAYQVGRAMGTFGEDCAAKYGFTREEQDTFAVESVSRAQQAARDGVLKWETVPVTIKSKKGDTVIELDERPQKLNVEKIPTLKPAFAANGTITAASSSGNADGAAALVLMRESTASKLGCKPIARIVGHASFAQEPEWFTTAPVGAIRKLYDKTGWKTADVDLFEINEAFAAVTMAAMKEHDIPRDKVNIHGGACAVGHPIGASGARIMVSLLGALKATQGKRGVATLCIGGGEATAIALEMV
ncbi:acetyl-CoA acetyltransferase [Achromobacter xylosoxidans]|uniref:Acetyl-CoA C-acyltransferase n=1 Tax=Achromobacter ruhlandii TaxID=72557 RepID=A0A848NC76_9BURK|nr:acetyl-CoA C-acyltransferase [Achromobacter ruhlandii]NMU90158.1 acetyl-CoA C-acyltransferase [Achromobacter ruhlandii]OCZ63049.1 acetyl-CoA acetyltransferase [Achromobacter xylosoxidans]OCZ96013.1 acetyl-CoA acetyltransferase [Achromobacter xylosoxidans]ODA18982.1 acetyl-CoA acetyltransferase [Achromobacter xylosoxidans]